MVREALTAILLLSGSLFMLVTGIGLLRLPDVFCRAHAQSKSMTMGICLMLLGLLSHLGVARAGLAVAAGILALVMTIPVAGHLVALVSYEKNVPRFKPKKAGRPRKN